ncbi:MAG: hypothetical protein GF344_03370, partial [Chitinivibrionales bacterium]|nr:hypothetical protein [Chitinivibrionales bacterium]
MKHRLFILLTLLVLQARTSNAAVGSIGFIVGDQNQLTINEQLVLDSLSAWQSVDGITTELIEGATIDSVAIEGLSATCNVIVATEAGMLSGAYLDTLAARGIGVLLLGEACGADADHVTLTEMQSWEDEALYVSDAAATLAGFARGARIDIVDPMDMESGKYFMEIQLFASFENPDSLIGKYGIEAYCCRISFHAALARTGNHILLSYTPQGFNEHGWNIARRALRSAAGQEPVSLPGVSVDAGEVAFVTKAFSGEDTLTETEVLLSDSLSARDYTITFIGYDAIANANLAQNALLIAASQSASIEFIDSLIDYGVDVALFDIAIGCLYEHISSETQHTKIHKMKITQPVAYLTGYQQDSSVTVDNTYPVWTIRDADVASWVELGTIKAQLGRNDYRDEYVALSRTGAAGRGAALGFNPLGYTRRGWRIFDDMLSWVQGGSLQAQPVADALVDTLYFSSADTEQLLQFSNTGTGILEVTGIGGADWISASLPTPLQIGVDKTEGLIFEAATEGLSQGWHYADLSVASNGSDAHAVVAAVQMYNSDVPQLRFSEFLFHKAYSSRA